MGIISRIINIANSQNSIFKQGFEKNIELINEEDDELKRIIEELNQNSTNETVDFSTVSEPNKYSYGAKKINISPEISNAFAILEINEFSDKEELNEAFKNKLKIYHPDKHQKSSKEEKDFFIKKTAELIEAYNTVKKLL